MTLITGAPNARIELENFGQASPFYGGDQHWFSETFEDHYSAMRCCGVIALLNQFVALGQRHELAMALWPEGQIPTDKKAYLEWAYTLRPYVWPAYYGLPTGGRIRRAAQRYAMDRGIELEWRVLKGRAPLEIEMAFLRVGLSMGAAVSHLCWRNAYNDLGYHWITITGLETKQDVVELDLPENQQNLNAGAVSPEEAKLGRAISRMPIGGDSNSGIEILCSNYGQKERYDLIDLRRALPLHRILQYPVLKE